MKTNLSIKVVLFTFIFLMDENVNAQQFLTPSAGCRTFHPVSIQSTGVFLGPELDLDILSFSDSFTEANYRWCVGVSQLKSNENNTCVTIKTMGIEISPYLKCKSLRRLSLFYGGEYGNLNIDDTGDSGYLGPRAGFRFFLYKRFSLTGSASYLVPLHNSKLAGYSFTLSLNYRFLEEVDW